MTGAAGIGIGRLNFIDALRGAAALMVAVGHFAEIVVSGYLGWSYESLSFGRAGVVAFFVVSGFVIPMSLEKSSQKRFWIGRAFRLYPSYWVNILIVLVLGALAVVDLSVSRGTLLANVLMLQTFTQSPNIVAPAWTLGIELVFYAQAALLAWRGRLTWGPYLGYAWLTAFVAAGVIAPMVGVRDLPITAPLLLFVAAIGHSVYSWYSDRWPLRRVLMLVGSGVVTVPLVAWTNFSVFPVPPEMTPLGPVQWTARSYALSFILGLLVFAVFFLCRSRNFPRWAVWLGAISYSLYLVHPAVYEVVLHVFDGAGMLEFAVYLAALLAVSGAIYRYVERPAIDLGRAVARKASVPRATGKA